MRGRLSVEMDRSGRPSAEVPFENMWELVEYLSYQRVSVEYQYHSTHFTVTFTRQDALSAQAILDNWVHAESGLQHA
jgi:hypothetical protein